AVVITPLVGPSAHPTGSRRQVSRTVAGSLMVSLALLILNAFGELTVPLLLGLAALRGVLAGLEVPSRQVLLTSSVSDKSRIGNAVAMNAIAYNGARMIGPAIAAAVYPTLGATYGFALTAASLALMLAIVRSMPTPAAIPGELHGPGKAGVSLRAAFDYVRRDRLASLFLPVATCLAVLGGSYQTLVPVLADRVHGSASIWTGVFFASAGAGSTVSALLLSSKYLYPASRHLQVITPWVVVIALAGLVWIVFAHRDAPWPAWA
ncbi:MAG: MFS transporter, partial [Quisquiliibacterium sp.]